MNKHIQPKFEAKEKTLDGIIEHFDTKGKLFGKAARNSIKLFPFENLTLNVKSFKIPNFINQVVYHYFRKSKAERSFIYACKLLKMGIGTPEPIAYYEFIEGGLFKKSFYLSKHLEADLTYRDLCHNLNYPDHEEILRAFTRFTYKLHENNVEFLDHSPGNTLIKKVEKGYDFYLVDLNRMNFKVMDFETRICNFARLTKHRSMIKTMSDEYAKISGEDFETVYELMWNATQEFQEKFQRKKRLKKKLKFWEK